MESLEIIMAHHLHVEESLNHTDDEDWDDENRVFD